MTPAISIEQLPFFSNLIKDYLRGDEKLARLFSFSPSLDGLRAAAASKEKNYTRRDVLKRILEKNYPDTSTCSPLERENIASLSIDGLAVTTAHQPNLFSGPLYTIIKACSTIALAHELSRSLSQKITPIFIIGSEDHDKEELLHAHLFGKRYEWQTAQKGAIGRMIVDDSFIVLRDLWTAQFGNFPHAEALKEIVESSYREGLTLSEGFGAMVRKLFGKHGLIVLDLQMSEVKEAMIPVFEREISEQISTKLIQPHLDFLQSEYKIQASPREINLFEFRDGERVRVEKNDEDILTRLQAHPELFSPNVILRPLMQQTVIPSIANIGGGAEVAYWLQLKPIFDAFGIDFPVILLRDIISPLDNKSWEKWNMMGLGISDFFQPIDELKRNYVLKDSSLDGTFQDIVGRMQEPFLNLEAMVSDVDKSLVHSVAAEKTKMEKSMDVLFQKIIKAEKKKNEDELLAMERIKNKVFENNILIERKENVSSYIIKYGLSWIDELLAICRPLEAQLQLKLD